MSVEKRSNRYYIKGAIKKDDGSWYHYTKLAQGCSGVKEAREYEREFRKQYQEICISLSQRSFNEICEEFKKNNKNIKNTTSKTNQEVLKKVCGEIGNKKINLISKKILQKYICDLESEYSEAYVSKIYYTINKVFKFACDKEYIQINPLAKVKLTKDKDAIKQEMLFWEPSQFETFIKYVDDIVYKSLFTFLYYMGVRKGEALALQWKDISFETDIVKIYKTVSTRTKNGANWELTSPKTKNSMRNITMPKIVKESLSKLRDHENGLYNFNNDNFVFGNYRPIPFENLRRNLINYIKRANGDGNTLSELRVHDFRHSHASFLINSKTNKFTDYDIAKRLGDTVETLHNTYAHWFRTADQGIIDMMDARNVTKTNSGYADLKELKELLDMGIITTDEFNIKKKEILGI